MGLSPVALYSAVYSDVSSSYVGSSPLKIPGLTYRQFASSYLVESVIRKWIPEDSSQADTAALESFTSANNRCRDWKFDPKSEWDLEVLGSIRRILDDFFHPSGHLLVPSMFDLLRSARPGPGANFGSIGTSFYTKYFSSKLTSTSWYLYDEYKRYAEWIPSFSDAECHRYEEFGPPSVVNGSRCSFVPKTSATSRMICVEPSVNMYYQLGLATLLQERLKSFFGIDLRTQPEVNRRLAQEGSSTGALCTIDLSSASDSISLRLCEMILPKWVFDLLVLLRSRTTLIDQRQVPLFMVSTMGNGFTFPLQTIIFAAILKACSESCGLPRDTWACFGDDLICEKRCFPRVISTLTLFGFKANPSKTFFEGPFRESCGTDWFYGQPVRPIFIKKLDTPQDYFVAINSLNYWSSYTGIRLKNTIRLLFDQLHRRFHTYVPFDSADDSGIKVPLAFINPRYNRNLSFVFKTWEKPSVCIRIDEEEIRLPRELRKYKIIYNPHGLYMSFLFGELGSSCIMVRHDRKMYKQRLRCIPYWDYIPIGSLINGVKLSWQQWVTAVGINLPRP